MTSRQTKYQRDMLLQNRCRLCGRRKSAKGKPTQSCTSCRVKQVLYYRRRATAARRRNKPCGTCGEKDHTSATHDIRFEIRAAIARGE